MASRLPGDAALSPGLRRVPRSDGRCAAHPAGAAFLRAPRRVLDRHLPGRCARPHAPGRLDRRSGPFGRSKALGRSGALDQHPSAGREASGVARALRDDALRGRHARVLRGRALAALYPRLGALRCLPARVHVGERLRSGSRLLRRRRDGHQVRSDVQRWRHSSLPDGRRLPRGAYPLRGRQERRRISLLPPAPRHGPLLRARPGVIAA
jgi:hypothetical protein